VDLKAWRRSERQRLLALRTAVPPVERRRYGAEMEAKLRTVLIERPVSTLGASATAAAISTEPWLPSRRGRWRSASATRFRRLRQSSRNHSTSQWM
jgi:hypothetical protein